MRGRQVYSRVLAVVLAGLCLAGAVSAAPVVLIDRFGPGDTYLSGGTGIGGVQPGDHYPAPDAELGYQFSFTGIGPVELNAIELPVHLHVFNEGPNVLELYFMSDAGDVPGTTIESFLILDQMPAWDAGLSAPVTATSVLRPILKPDTQYWVVASTPPDSTAVWMNAPLDPGWEHPIRSAYRIVPTDPWSVSGMVPGGQAFRVTGDPIASPVPTPGALILGTLGTGLAAWLRRRRAL